MQLALPPPMGWQFRVARTGGTAGGVGAIPDEEGAEGRGRPDAGGGAGGGGGTGVRRSSASIRKKEATRKQTAARCANALTICSGRELGMLK
jgi:hypothetical protein